MVPVAIGRRILLAAFICGIVAGASGGRPARAAADPAVVAPIQALYDSLLTVMKAGTKTPFAKRFDMLAPAVDRALDVATILQVSVGSMWNTLSPDQHAALLEAFRRYTISSYVGSFDNYSGQRFSILPDTRTVGPDQVILQTQIVPVSGDSHRLDYVMRQAKPDWKAVDILADGAISRVATQRSDFRGLLMRGGSEALLASLQHKTADLASGSQP